MENNNKSSVLIKHAEKKFDKNSFNLKKRTFLYIQRANKAKRETTKKINYFKAMLCIQAYQRRQGIRVLKAGINLCCQAYIFGLATEFILRNKMREMLLIEKERIVNTLKKEGKL